MYSCTRPETAATWVRDQERGAHTRTSTGTQTTTQAMLDQLGISEHQVSSVDEDIDEGTCPKGLTISCDGHNYFNRF